MNDLRPAAFAGSFYPEDEVELKNQINKYLKAAVIPKDLVRQIKAIIVPHAGFIYSGPVAAYGYKLIKGIKYKNVIIFGPSHQMMFQNIALTNFEFWKTPLGNTQLSPLSKKLQEESYFNSLDEVHAFEHSIEVQLPFLQTVLKDFRITPLVTGRVDNHKEIAKSLNEHLDKDTLIVVSSDLSHYLPYEEANKIDNKTIKQILELDTDIDPEQACGADGIIILIELAKLLKWKAKLLDYRSSGDTAGDESRVVGYASIVFYK
jgi:AmmeMemoRadiSam system protein B